MQSARREPIPIRPIFFAVLLMIVLLLLGYGWIEGRWGVVNFYLVLTLLSALFLAPPIWSYSRRREDPETSDAGDDFDSHLDEELP